MIAATRLIGFAAFLLLPVIILAGCGGDDGPTGPGEFPDVRGTWIGQYSVVSCTTLSGSDPFFCQDLFYQGSSRFHDVQLAQNQSSVSGTAWQGQASGSVEGTISELGVLTLDGQIGVGEPATTTIEDWQAVLVGDSLVGGWTFVFEDNGNLGFGSARIDADFTLIDPAVPNFNSCPVEETLAQTDGVSGLLGPGDCQLVGDESYYDVYSVNVSPGDRIEIQLRSSEFDPVLFIFDLEQRGITCSAPTGTVDCAYTNAPDSVAAVALEAIVAETWLIVPNTVAGGETGGYTLTTQALAGAGLSTTLTLHRATLSVRSGEAAGLVGRVSTVGSTSNGIMERFTRPTSREWNAKRTAVDAKR